MKVRLVSFTSVCKKCELGYTQNLSTDIFHTLPPFIALGVKQSQWQSRTIMSITIWKTNGIKHIFFAMYSESDSTSSFIEIFYKWIEGDLISCISAPLLKPNRTRRPCEMEEITSPSTARLLNSALLRVGLNVFTSYWSRNNPLYHSPHCRYRESLNLKWLLWLTYHVWQCHIGDKPW